MEKIKIKITESLQVAINFLQKLEDNNSLVIKNWKNFFWFNYIGVGDTQEVGQDTTRGSVYTMLEKTISFYGYKETLIARVHLKGNRFKNTDETTPTFWRVAKVEYALDYDESRACIKMLQWSQKEVSIEESPFA